MALKELNPLLHSQLRLAVISLLAGVKEADFSYLKVETNSTAGNLSVQLQKLKEADYIEIEKTFKNNYPQTSCKLTKNGMKAFNEYVDSLKEYLSPKLK